MGERASRGPAAVEVLGLKGDFDGFAAEAFAATIRKLQEEDGCHRIVLNLRLVKFVNSSAFREMIRTHKSCRRGGGGLAVSQPSRAVCEAMQLLGLDRLFDICQSDEEAIASLQEAGGRNGRSDVETKGHRDDGSHPHRS